MADLFQATPELRHIHQAALSRGRSPLAVLAMVLAAVSTSAGPQHLLPPVVGAPATPNLFVNLVGPTSDGKSTAAGIAKELVPAAFDRLKLFPAGTGEGLISAFLAPKPDSEGNSVQVADRVFIYVDELTQMTEQASRSGNTFMSIVRMMAHGSDVGNGNADPARRRQLSQHTYRLGLVVAVQPPRSGPLLTSEEISAGTPQRMLWVSTARPYKIVRPEWPGALTWTPPREVGPTAGPGVMGGLFPAPHQDITYPDDVAAYVVAMDDTPPGEDDPMALEGHSVLTRLKVAAALAGLHGRWGTFTHLDWMLAGVLIEHSRSQVTRCLAAVREANRAGALGQATAKGELALVTEDAKASHGTDLAAGRLLRYLETRAGLEFSTKDLRQRALNQATRGYAMPALERLVGEGRVTRREGRKAGSWLWSAADPNGRP